MTAKVLSPLRSMKYVEDDLPVFRFAEQSLLFEPRLEDQVRAEDNEQERSAEVELEDHLGETTNQGKDAKESGKSAHA